MRRGVGIGALKKAQDAKVSYGSVGAQLEETRLEQIRSALSLFHSNLAAFARDYRASINSNPIFRRQFNELCSKVGVDPLATQKSVWSQLLGFGDFYYEIAIQAIEIAFATRPANGGLISVKDMTNRLKQRRIGSKQSSISEDDVIYAIRKLNILGNGFRCALIGSTNFFLSVPIELNTDHIQLISFAEKNQGKFIIEEIIQQMNWTTERITNAMKMILEEGIVWIDNTPQGIQVFYVVATVLSRNNNQINE